MMDYEQAASRCWLEIDLDAVEANYASAVRLCGEGVRVICVLKGNAYGLGAAKLSRVLAAAGADLFAVAELGEALEIKRACGRDVLVLGMVAPVQLDAAVRCGVIFTAYSLQAAQAIDAAAARAGTVARVHLKLDTGMHRLGLDAERDMEDALVICRLPHIRLEGLFTHLALRTLQADAAQIGRFLFARDALVKAGVDCGMLHASDSIGMVRYPGYRFDAVRTGAWLYGMVPSRYPNSNGECRMALRLMTRVVQLRRVAAGEYVSYDEDHPLSRDSVVATLSAGYADGYPRINNTGAVQVRGCRAPIVGLTCMDQMTVDVTDVPGVQTGDAVTLIGDGIDIAEVADWAHTNRNDLLCRFGRRVPRVYMRGGLVDEVEAVEQI